MSRKQSKHKLARVCPAVVMMAIWQACSAGVWAAEPLATPGTNADTAVVLDDTTLWRQFNIGFCPADKQPHMGALHVRDAKGTLLLTGASSIFGGHRGAPLIDFSAPSACRHGRQEPGSAGVVDPLAPCAPGAVSPLPPADWAGPTMDDSAWPRVRLPQPLPTEVAMHNSYGWGGATSDRDRPDMAKNPYATVGVLTRATFLVTDPAQVKGCNLSLDYWGGVVVYVNGQEVARGHMPGNTPDLFAPAADYPEEAFLTAAGKPIHPAMMDDEKNRDRLALRDRNLRDVKIPAAVLRKGVNVLAIETHPATVPLKALGMEVRGVIIPDNNTIGCAWAPIGLLGARLTVSPGGAAVANRVRPQGIQLWNCKPSDTVTCFDYGNPAEQLQPIMVSAARNSVFSGRLMVGSDRAIKGLKVRVADLALIRDATSGSAGAARLNSPKSSPSQGAHGGNGRANLPVSRSEKTSAETIPSSAMRIRYAIPATPDKSWVPTYRFDGLFDTIPAEIPLIEAAMPPPGMIAWSTDPQACGRRTATLEEIKAQGMIAWTTNRQAGVGEAVAVGAIAPLWFTVRVSRDIQPGLYEGQVTVEAEGLAPTQVPLRVKVSDWTTPDVKAFRVQNSLYHAEEVQSKYYGVTNYSGKHLELVGKTLTLAAELSSRQVQVNLVIGFNGNNPESLVRWIPQPDGSYRHDFRNFDNYLDMVAKSIGRPRTLRLNGLGYDGTGSYREPGRENGGRVTVLDPATGKLSTTNQPAMGTPEYDRFWQPVFDEVLRKVKARGWLEETTIGYNDVSRPPPPKLVDFVHRLWPTAEWSFTSHYGGSGMKFVGSATNIAMTVRHVDSVFAQATPDVPLWALDQPRRNFNCNTCRNICQDYSPLRSIRRELEYFATGLQFDGMSENGLDLFPLPRPAGGYCAPRAGRGTFWSEQWTTLALLYPGPDGPVATERYEMLREGIEIAEAILFIQHALERNTGINPELQARTMLLLSERRGWFPSRYMLFEADAALLELAGEVERATVLARELEQKK